MLAPGVTVTGILSVAIRSDRLILHALCSDGTTAVTWWSISEDLPRFTHVFSIDATPREDGVALQ
jgi:hypothetical protein